MVSGGAIVGLVKAATFEDDTTSGAEQPFDRSCIGANGRRACFELSILHALKNLKAFPASLAFVIVIRHRANWHKRFNRASGVRVSILLPKILANITRTVDSHESRPFLYRFVKEHGFPAILAAGSKLQASARLKENLHEKQ